MHVRARVNDAISRDLRAASEPWQPHTSCWMAANGSGRKHLPTPTTLNRQEGAWQVHGRRVRVASLLCCLVQVRDLPRSPGDLRALAAHSSWGEAHMSSGMKPPAAHSIHSGQGAAWQVRFVVVHTRVHV